MIAALKGKIRSISPESIVLDVNGVGYELMVTASVIGSMGEVGDELDLLVYTDVRENAILLFGFRETMEREMFLLLKKVKGVGSRLALTIVSWLDAEALLSAIGHADVHALQGVPGVGKKTAERLVVELREQVGNLAGAQKPEQRRQIEKIKINGQDVTAAGALTAADDAVLALEKLGFSSERARQAVSLTLKDGVSENAALAKDAGELLRRALVNL